MEFQKYNVKENKKKKKEEKKQSHKNYLKKYRYKTDNKYQKAKIKNLEWSLEFQEYNVKRRRKRKRKEKQSHKNCKENIGTKFITNAKKQKLKI